MQPGWHWGPAFKVFFAMWSITRKSEAQQWRLGKVCARERGAGTLSVSPARSIQQTFIIDSTDCYQSLHGAVRARSGSGTVLERRDVQSGSRAAAVPPGAERSEPGVEVTDFPCGPLMKNIWSASVPPLLSCPQYDQAM